MTKKSLVLGAAALALLALLAFVGCSNPSSSDAAAAPQAGGVESYPPGTVFTDSTDELEGLLNNPASVDTNAVTHIVYTGATLSRQVTIPGGKTVYWNNDLENVVDLAALTNHIIVEPGARLVLEDNVTTAEAGKLLVKGTVEVYERLIVTYVAGPPANYPAQQVADYFEADGTITARDTVIGTSHVLIGAGGTLVLQKDDITNDPSSANRFTPAQAWAAAGQGHLAIIGDPLTPTYTVTYLLEGVYPSADRWYIVTTDGGGGGDDGKTIPSIIPAGAVITANGVIEGAVGRTLTVNGRLYANNAASTFKNIDTLTVNGRLQADSAAFESVKTLTISGANTDNLASRSAGSPSEDWNAGYLGADNATLKSAESIIIGDNGEFESASKWIDLPEGARISLGRSARFSASSTDPGNSFDKLESLFIGPASRVNIDSPSLTFKSLRTLTLQDSATLTANAPNTLTFLVEATPATPLNKTRITWGLNATLDVAAAPTAKIDVVIDRDASLVGGQVTVNDGSTFTVAAGVKLAVNNGAGIDLGNLGTTVPTAGSEPVRINGTLEFNSGASLWSLDPFTLANAADANKFVAFGDGGKILFNEGSKYYLYPAGKTQAESAATLLQLIGATGDGGSGDFSTPGYLWAAAPTGAQFEVNGGGINIRDTNGGGAAISANGPGTVILPGQTLTLEAGANINLESGGAVWFTGDASNGAKLAGPGALVSYTDGWSDVLTKISGGSSGWQAVGGTGTIGITRNTTGGSTVTTDIVSAATTTVLTALGRDAVITQYAGGTSSDSLVFGANAVVDLGGTATAAGGSIVLKAAASNPGTLSFTDATGKILLAGGAGTALSTNTPVTIGGKGVTITTLAAANFFASGSTLTQIVGAASGTIAPSGTTPDDDDVTIVSNAAFTQ